MSAPLHWPTTYQLYCGVLRDVLRHKRREAARRQPADSAATRGGGDATPVTHAAQDAARVDGQPVDVAGPAGVLPTPAPAAPQQRSHERSQAASSAARLEHPDEGVSRDAARAALDRRTGPRHAGRHVRLENPPGNPDRLNEERARAV